MRTVCLKWCLVIAALFTFAASAQPSGGGSATVTFGNLSCSTNALNLFLRSYTFCRQKAAWGTWSVSVQEATAAHVVRPGVIAPAVPESRSIAGYAVPAPVAGLVLLQAMQTPLPAVGAVQLWQLPPFKSDSAIMFEGKMPKLVGIIGTSNFKGAFCSLDKTENSLPGIAVVPTATKIGYKGIEVPVYLSGTPAPATQVRPRPTQSATPPTQ